MKIRTFARTWKLPTRTARIFSVDIFHLFLKAVEMEFEKKAIANKGDWFSNGEYLGAVNSIV